MIHVDLNADLGEGYGAYTICNEEELIPLLTSANIACGFHAGDPNIMRKVTQLCADNEVGIGVHPGFPDLLGFGRRFMQCKDEELENYLYYQIGALEAFAKMAGKRIQHCNAHGAWGNWHEKDPEYARKFVGALAKYDKNIIVKAISGGYRQQIAKEMGLRVASEFFADRQINNNGRLVPRSIPGSVIHDKDMIVERVLRAVIKREATSFEGVDIPVQVDTITIHGDTEGSIEIIRSIREALLKNGVVITKMEDFI
ncbi:MAG TPA: 5-oxoprolinase subunit PxpA [Bacillota bacterium]|nr:5-oxoprolinase subunit PxpA [Bacillota bacterium]HOR86785.1 5-oxoprolinase subunit PxpA [Bacillota bacterium]HPL52867.1 5-oxoprolinase subunit PxpA [Bacillota bacterium]